jgi:hypothetical protein
MANGLYGKAATTAVGGLTKATTSTPVAGKVRTVSVGAVNTTDNAMRISIAVAATTDPNAVVLADYKVSGRPLDPHDEYERTNLVLDAGEHVFVQADIDGAVFDIRGFEGNA